MNTTDFDGWKNCIELQSGDFKLIITTETGPRIIGGFLNKNPNFFYVDPKTAGKKGGDEWRLYGGHRLWTAPEAIPRTYEPDNSMVHVEPCNDGISFSSGTDPRTGIHKTIEITPLNNNKFEIKHRLINKGMWEIKTAAWVLSVMAPGGTAVVPVAQGQEGSYAPKRLFSLWFETYMNDPRLTFTKNYIMVKQKSGMTDRCKIGSNCEAGWLAYVNTGTVFVKSFEYIPDAEYPDNNSCVEVFTNSNMLEMETLSPLKYLKPGDEIIHAEYLQAFEIDGEVSSEEDIEEKILPLVRG